MATVFMHDGLVVTVDGRRLIPDVADGQVVVRIPQVAAKVIEAATNPTIVDPLKALIDCNLFEPLPVQGHEYTLVCTSRSCTWAPVCLSCSQPVEPTHMPGGRRLRYAGRYCCNCEAEQSGRH